MPFYSLDGQEPELSAPQTVFIAPGAYAIGRVRLGENVGIWFGATLRGDNEWIEIGDGSNIQENVVCHTDMGFPLTVGAFCTIGHSAILHGCTIGDGTTVGMGATVLNGATVGRNSLIGAGALVTEGKTFPDGVLLLGQPARVVRPLEESEIARLRQGAEHYVEKARLFRSTLTVLPQEKAEA
ncbi:gamma carbonic anhydrase family protein [Consotaella salsifontis]|uniref:Carbonic anhydrase or acetyltransferase, isoleucine patch superfamily n=1 Tax=Consotaella salsifontis TaxID=1365950 RepID=A0A1T4T682_9HYPH|nr:gamma carbonic anhydrase family protein [Consotaella salsifontis]SKA35923.1 Carbonic anhydrase or acetyltransferase, isoleucine patch superfamily [Consotaella salsifontis]